MLAALRYEDYTIGWICALHVEALAARFMLDKRHDGVFPGRHGDDNNYIAGSIGSHNVVLAGLPTKSIGTVSAAILVSQMRQSFPNLRYGLMVGIGAGVPGRHLKPDVRLGDVVVAAPTEDSDDVQCVIGYELGKETAGGFIKKNWLYPTDLRLRTAISTIQTETEFNLSHGFLTHLEVFQTKPEGQKFLFPGVDNDQLYEAEQADDKYSLVARDPRDSQNPVVHYGRIGSGNKVIKNAKLRDELRDKYNIICLEMEAAGLMNTLPVAVIRGICDYADCHKNDTWRHYAAATAASYAKELLYAIGADPPANPRLGGVLCADETKCLQSLYKSDYKSHGKRNPDRVPGTCEWFLRHPKYRCWRQERQSSLLWVSGDPGCGKSVLVSFLLGELKSDKSQAILPGTVCFFYFKDDNDKQNSATSALCAILHQLFTTKKFLVKHAMPEYENKDQKFTNEFSTLWDICTTALNDADCGNVICVLDGLDECELLTRNLLIDSLIKFFSASGSRDTNSFLKFIVTSRPYGAIERRFYSPRTTAPPTIRLKMEDETTAISRDIELVVKAKVEEIGHIKSLPASARADLQKRLISNADWTFLWVSLILQMVEESARVSRTALNDIATTIPGTLHAVYDKILRQVSNDEASRKLLHIIVAAVRPLSLEEMNVALNITRCDHSNEDLDLEPSIHSTIKELCGTLVKIVKSKVYLVHHTAKEFLTRSNGEIDMSLGPWKHSLYLNESNLILTEACTWYLLFSHVQDHPLEINLKSPSLDIESQVDQYARRHKFLDYAAKNWATHFQQTGIQGNALLKKTILDVCDSGLGSGSSFRVEVIKRSLQPKKAFKSPWIALHWAARSGYSAVVQGLLENGASAASKTHSGWTALCWAASTRHRDIVELLLNKGADVRTKTAFGWTPLHLAVGSGHISVVQLLLENGSEIDAKDPDGCTASHRALDMGRNTLLHSAAASGQEEVVRLLLRNGANIASKAENGETALHKASASGSKAIVRMLLEGGAEINCSDNAQRTALHYATKVGDEDILRLLLDGGADVAAKDMCGGTALHLAAESGNEAILRILLETGIDVMERNALSGETALHRAAGNGHDTVVRLLLEEGALVNAKDVYGGTSLHWAFDSENGDLIRLLLKQGADTNATTIHGGTVLHRAAWNGNVTAVRMLIENGVDIYYENRIGQTAAILVVMPGYEDIVRLLLKQPGRDLGDDMIAMNPENLPHLHWAARPGHKAITELLLMKGVDVNERDFIGSISLHQAISSGNKKMVLILLDKGTDVNTRYLTGRTALHEAVLTGNGEIVSLLLEKGADINARYQGGWTALHEAVLTGNKEIVSLLLERGPDINATYQRGWTALHEAVSTGNREIVSLLLEKGARNDIVHFTG
ncbi:Ankyrin repeat-containing domain protein [Metarhizium brunneum]